LSIRHHSRAVVRIREFRMISVICSRRYLHAFVLAVAILCSRSPDAHAISLTLAGPDPQSVATAADVTSTIWAGASDGPLVEIVTIGAGAPGGGTFTDIGVPSISPDNDVIFGAEVTDPNGVARWEIYRGSLTAPADRRVVPAIDSRAVSRGCVPNIKLDPYPVAGSNGAIAFIAPEAAGSDVLFRYSDGELTCAVRIGDRTADGRVLKLMHFGSATMAPSGEVAFNARIDDIESSRSPGAHHNSHLAIILAAPHEPIREIAVEGSREPGGGRYLGGFGLPSAVSTTHGAMVAFTAMNTRGLRARGYGLYLFRGGKTVEVLASGDRTSVGLVSFLSNGRPAISASGLIAVRGASAGRRAILTIRNGHRAVVVAPGHATEIGSRIVSFGDPVICESGRILVNIIDDHDRNLLDAVDSSNAVRLAMPVVHSSKLIGGFAPPVLAGRLAVNEGGAFTFIGGK
jgi:hypothetical protein